MYAVSLTRNYIPPARAAPGAHRLASAGRLISASCRET